MGDPSTAYQANLDAIEKKLKSEPLTSTDLVNLTIARRLCSLSDVLFAQALGGTAAKPALNWLNKR